MSRFEELKAGLEHERRLRTDFPYFAEQMLVVRNKAGQLVKFKLNSVQLKLWDKIQEEMRTKGRCRLAVTKMRQGGLSTFCAAIAVWRLVTEPGTQALVMGHRDDSASHVLRMVGTMIAHMDAESRPAIDIDNSTELRFKSGSGFSMRVASDDGSSARGQTATVCHLTEAAYFGRWDENLDSLTAIVPDLPGTILIAETTGNYLSSPYYNFFQKALQGLAGDWSAWFAPWFWMDEYSEEPPSDFEVSPDESELKTLYNLTDAQIAWRRRVRASYSDPAKFAREMPANIIEAYPGEEHAESFFPTEDIMRARKAEEGSHAHGPLIFGCDLSYAGKDRCTIARRRGSEILSITSYKVGAMEFCGILGKLIDKEKPERCFLDATGGGIIAVQRMHELGYDECEGIHFSAASGEIPELDESGRERRAWHNKRAELFGLFKKMLADGAKIPDSDSLHGEMRVIGFKTMSSGAVAIEDKQSIKKRLKGMSIDELDSCVVSMAGFAPGSSRTANSAKPRGFAKGHVLTYFNPGRI